MTTPSENINVVRKIVHIDMDAFYASVEQRDNPALRGRPVIVGGQPNSRGVVAACSYEARTFGVRSAMPCSEAARRCPQAVFVPPRFNVYQQVSTQLHDVFSVYSDLVEPLSLDEAYLDVTDSMIHGGSAFKIARDIKEKIKASTNLVASAGVSYNKFLAKIASDFDKPDGLFCILPEQGESFVASLPVGRFYGVGKATEQRMHELNIMTGADLKQFSITQLQTEFGKSASFFYHAARGIDYRLVSSSRERKSVGAETTFMDNIQSEAHMLDELDRLCERVVEQVKNKGLYAKTMTIKVRFSNFDTLTRSHTKHSGISSIDAAKQLLPFLLRKALSERHMAMQQLHSHVAVDAKVRLLGVSLSSLQDPNEGGAQQLEFNF